MSSENSAADPQDNIQDTDNDSIECFQNYSASEVFIQGLAGLVDQQDVESMIRAQKQILQRFEKTNEMLSNCNSLSVSRLKIAGQQFKTYKQLLVDIRKDLDYTFKKINVLKSRLQTQYPDSSAASSSKVDSYEEETKDLREETKDLKEESLADLSSTTENNEITADSLDAEHKHDVPETESSSRETKDENEA